MNRTFLLFALSLLSSLSLFSESFSGNLSIPSQLLEKGVVLDMNDPSYSDGTLETTSGGVLESEELRVQALCLSYSKKEGNWTIEATGDLFVLFGDYLFRGERLFYDFNTKEGTIEGAVLHVEPWFFGAKLAELRADGSLLLYNGYATTSEKDEPEWGIYSGLLELKDKEELAAKNIEIRYKDYPILWIPSLRSNLNSIFDSPLTYRFGWGGRQGPRFGVEYEVFSWNHWKTFLRFDYRLTRGPGGGIETYYHAPDGKFDFHLINYIAKDSSILKVNEKARYRFEGNFKKISENGKTAFLLTYDKISDIDMPNCYYDQDFFIQTAYRTQAMVRHQEERWISTLYSRVRINSFETVKEELPTFRLSLKPLSLSDTGIVFQNSASASYLDFRYSKNLLHFHNYASTRFYTQPLLYRPFHLGNYFTWTPEIGGVGAIYGNSPSGEEEWLALGKAGFNLNTRLTRVFGENKHVIEPYLSYSYYSGPTVSPKKHYIFDILDGVDRLNYCTIGFKNSLYAKNSLNQIQRPYYANVYAYIFFDTNKMKRKIPRIYGDFSLEWTPRILQTLTSAWSLERNNIDHFNLLTAWTISDDSAFTIEYRHRNAYSWRKVDQENFFLDVYRSEKRLRHSLVSDRRDTLLLHLFYRFHPEWACEVTTRQGWNRIHQPSYWEYEIDLLTTIQTAWQVRCSYQHQENENRLVMYVNVGMQRPSSADLNYRMATF